MKLKACAAILLAATSGMAMAENEGSGCGLGQMVWEGQSGFVAHTSAGTTNGLLANQLFGITSNTLGCDNTKTVELDRERQIYAAANLDKLTADAARGEGESMTVLASLMNVDAADSAAFAAFTQQQFDTVFAAGSDSVAVLAALDVALKQHATLARYARA